MGLIGGVLGAVAATGLLAALVPYNMLIVETIFCVLPVAIQQTTVQDSQLDRLTNQPTNNNSHYDFIIVGAGSAGAVVANRLINSPSNYRVLVLEQGGEQQWPTYFAGFDVVDTGYHNFDYKYHSTPQVNSCQACTDKTFTYPRGKSLGGTSTLNFMMYLRGSPRDFDKWAAYAEDDSWNSTYAELLYQTHEHYTGLYPQNGAHGCGGELNIDQLRFKHQAVDTYQAAVTEQQSNGNLFLRDVNQNQNNSYMLIESTTSNGFRWSTNTAFLSGIPRKTDRFTIQKFSGVTKLIFSQDTPDKVIGVEYAWHPDTAFVGGVKVEPLMFRAFADKEVILSAGAINSPQILMHSGIGPRDQLDALSIPVKKELPVGKNLQDHVTIPLFVQLKKTGISFVPERDLEVDTLGSLPRNPVGWLGGTAIVGTGFYSTALNDDATHPDIQNILTYVGMSKVLDLVLSPMVNIAPKEYQDIQRLTHGQNDGHVAFSVVARPWSTGSVTLNATAFQSTPEPYRYFQKPIIDPNYFAEQHDIDVAIAGVQNLLHFFNTSSQYKDIYNFLGGINYCNDIKAPKHSYEYLKCYIKYYTLNLWHLSGTCKMGKQGDPTAVVDSRLRVQGIQNLRVIDASIMPNVTNANTNAPSILIGEKGARMIIEDHQGLQYPEKMGKRRECTSTEQPLVLPTVDTKTLAEMPNLLSIVQNATAAALKTNFDHVDTTNFDTSEGNTRDIPFNVCLKTSLQYVLNLV